eukprot:gene2340-3042_t
MALQSTRPLRPTGRSLRSGARGCRFFPCVPRVPWTKHPFPMVKGQKVVCINDTFSNFIRALYKQLPVKGNTYTIREVFLGREKIVKGGETATVGLLLAELTNPPDPFHQGQQEL